MIFRPATTADALGIATVHVLTWQSAYRGIVSNELLDSLAPEQREPMWRESLERGEPEVWVAESSEIVGWIAFGDSRDDDASENTGEMLALYVHPDHWSQGIGRELWLKAQRRLAERGFEFVTLWVLADNERGLRFYRAAGFEPCPNSEKPVEIGGSELRELRYRAVVT